MSAAERLLRAAALVLGLVVVVLALAGPTPVAAQGRRRRARTPVASTATAVTGAVGGAGALAAGIALHLTSSGGSQGGAGAWRGGFFIDEGTRDGLRLSNESARETAATISDALMVATMLNALAVDAFAIPLAQDDPHLAWQASAAYSLALGVTLVLNDIVKESIGRARPFERACQQDPSSPMCSSPDTYASFYSGHTAVAFTSAGFSCAMHLSRSLYDDPAADVASCAASLAVAATTGLLRIASDRHYASDVIVGALIGFLVGYVTPLIFVPERAVAEPVPDDELEEGEERIAPPLPGPTIMAVPTVSMGPDGLSSLGFGINVSGTF